MSTDHISQKKKTRERERERRKSKRNKQRQASCLCYIFNQLNYAGLEQRYYILQCTYIMNIVYFSNCMTSHKWFNFSCFRI